MVSMRFLADSSRAVTRQTARRAPLEVVKAARWLQDPGHANLREDQLAEAVEAMPRVGPDRRGHRAGAVSYTHLTLPTILRV